MANPPNYTSNQMDWHINFSIKVMFIDIKKKKKKKELAYKFHQNIKAMMS